MRPLLLALLVSFVVPVSTGCGGPANEAAADVLIPIEEENRLGQQMRAELEKELTIHSNAELQSYVKGLGQKAARGAGNQTPKGIKYDFIVVDDDKTVNAFAIPGGSIYVYTGLLKKASSEAEVMGVLGHEVAHVTNRHVAQRLVAIYGVSALAGIALGENPSTLAQIVANVAANGFLLKYSRDAEREADRYGVAFSARAGYDPNGFISFFKKMEGGGPAFLASHPAPAERVENTRKVIGQLTNPPTYTGAEVYAQKKAQFGL